MITYWLLHLVTEENGHTVIDTVGIYPYESKATSVGKELLRKGTYKGRSVRRYFVKSLEVT